MAEFMLKEKGLSVLVRATRITYEGGGYIVAWWNGECSAIFQASEVVGCWLESDNTNIC